MITSDSLESFLENRPEEGMLLSAMAVLRERMARMSRDDRADLLELFPLVFGEDREERESALRAVREMLVDRPVQARALPIPTGIGDDLTKWTAYVSKAIKSARTEKGLTQVELATMAGIPQPHLSRLERGEHSPTRMTLEKIAKALELPVSRFDPSAGD